MTREALHRTKMAVAIWCRVNLIARLERVGASIAAPLANIDGAVLGVVVFAAALGLTVFVATPEEPAKLNRLLIEHVVLFGMVDSTPFRLAYFCFFGALVAGALLLPFTGVAKLPSMATPARERSIAVAFFALIGGHLFAIDFTGLLTPSGVTPWVNTIYAAYAACVAVFVWNRRLAAWVIFATTTFVLLLAWWPAVSGLMLRVSVLHLPLVDEHFAALFSGGELLNFGYRLFVDVPIAYGILTPLGMAAAIRF